MTVRVLVGLWESEERTLTPGAAISTSAFFCEKSATASVLSTAATETTVE